MLCLGVAYLVGIPVLRLPPEYLELRLLLLVVARAELVVFGFLEETPFLSVVKGLA